MKGNKINLSLQVSHSFEWSCMEACIYQNPMVECIQLWFINYGCKTISHTIGTKE